MIIAAVNSLFVHSKFLRLSVYGKENGNSIKLLCLIVDKKKTQTNKKHGKDVTNAKQKKITMSHSFFSFPLFPPYSYFVVLYPELYLYL